MRRLGHGDGAASGAPAPLPSTAARSSALPSVSLLGHGAPDAAARADALAARAARLSDCMPEACMHELALPCTTDCLPPVGPCWSFGQCRFEETNVPAHVVFLGPHTCVQETAGAFLAGAGDSSRFACPDPAHSCVLRVRDDGISSLAVQQLPHALLRSAPSASDVWRSLPLPLVCSSLLRATTHVAFRGREGEAAARRRGISNGSRRN